MSTRDLRACQPCYQCLKCQRLHECQWRRVPIDEFVAAHAGDVGRLTIIYIHGNRTDYQWAVTRGKQVYQQIFGCCSQRPPVRFVIWHWPADPSRRYTRDLRQNAFRAPIEGQHLGWFLSQTDPGRPIGLIGYSLGAQVVLTGLEQTARAVGTLADGVSQRRVAIIAPATNCAWPNCCQKQLVADQFQKMVVINNASDLALRAYAAFCRHRNHCSGHKGVTGIAALYGENIVQYDVSAMVGPKHSIGNYVAPGFVQRQVREVMFSGDLTGAIFSRAIEGSEILEGHFE